MGTWIQAREKIRRDLWRPGPDGIPEATVDENLHAALMEIESEKRWAFLEVIWETTEAFRGNRLSLPRNSKQVNWMVWKDLDGRQRDLLRFAPLNHVRELQVIGGHGRPTLYAVSGYEIYLDRRATKDGRLECCYTFATPERIDLAVADGNENVTLDLQFQLVCALASMHIATGFLKDNAEADRQNASYQRLFESLMKQDDQAREDNFDPTVQADYGHDGIQGYSYG